MDHLWTPWRYQYVSSADKVEGCVFCHAQKQPDDQARIVFRGEHNMVILNTYPYNTGHVMVVPFAHLDELQKLPEAGAIEMIRLAQRVEGYLRELYHPDGVNLGMNLGRSAGAGVAGHIHMHLLPRWSGDTNFMTVVGETRVLPETLDITYRRLRDRFEAE